MLSSPLEMDRGAVAELTAPPPAAAVRVRTQEVRHDAIGVLDVDLIEGPLRDSV